DALCTGAGAQVQGQLDRGAAAPGRAVLVGVLPGLERWRVCAVDPFVAELFRPHRQGIRGSRGLLRRRVVCDAARAGYFGDLAGARLAAHSFRTSLRVRVITRHEQARRGTDASVAGRAVTIAVSVRSFL